MPVPQTYVTRLKAIHAFATHQVYGNKAVFTTTETNRSKFETFMTIGKVTRRYCQVPLPTAATVETDAICHSLKYLTNFLGYKIIDLNYPTLARLVPDLNRQSTQMTLLQCRVSNAEEHAQQLYEALPSLHEDFSAATASVDNIGHLYSSMQRLNTRIEDYHTKIFTLCAALVEAKVPHKYHPFPLLHRCPNQPLTYTKHDEHIYIQVEYFSEHLNIRSPTSKPTRWLELLMEDGTYAPPPATAN